MGIIDNSYHFGTLYYEQNTSQPSSSEVATTAPNSTTFSLANNPPGTQVACVKQTSTESKTATTTSQKPNSPTSSSTPPHTTSQSCSARHSHRRHSEPKHSGMDTPGSLMTSVRNAVTSSSGTTQTTSSAGTTQTTSSSGTTQTTSSAGTTQTTSSAGTTQTTSSAGTTSSVPNDSIVDHYRVFSSGYVTKQPPGTYPPAPSDQIYEYNGSSWVLTSMAAIESQYHLSPTMSMSPDDVYDSTGRIIGGDDYHPGYSVQIPNGARSKSPDRTYLPAPSGSHYKYDQAHHTWVMEADKSLLYGTYQHWDPEPSGTHTIYVPSTVNATQTDLNEVVSFTDGTPPSSSSPTSSSIPATQTTSGSTLPTSASDTDTTKYRVYTSGDVTKHPPGGYPPAPSEQIYEYNGSTWVLTSMSALPAQYSLSPTMSMSDDDVYDSSGRIIAGDDYHPHYASQIPNHAISKSPDRTFLPPPSDSHYAYDQAKHSWYLEADSVVMGTSVWPQPQPHVHTIYTFDSSNSSWHLINVYSDGTPASA